MVFYYIPYQHTTNQAKMTLTSEGGVKANHQDYLGGRVEAEGYFSSRIEIMTGG